MRIHFRNVGHAKFCLKLCKQLLSESLNIPEGERLSTQLTRNALCKGLGYSNYPELERLLTRIPRDLYIAPAPEDLHYAFALAFLNALACARQHGFQYEEASEVLSLRLAEKALARFTASNSLGSAATRGGTPAPDTGRDSRY